MNIIKKMLLFAGIGLITSCYRQKDESDFFVFEPDIRLFTSYAFMNAAGFDFDYESMHPIRIEVRQHIDSILTDEYKRKIKDYYQKLGGGNFYAYGVYALNCSFPPDFSFQGDTVENETLRDFYGYDVWLKEFYEVANIKEIWERHKENLLNINRKHEPYAHIALRQITDFCRIDTNYFQNNVSGHFYYQKIPLMSHFTGFYSEFGDDCWIVYGPSPEGEAGPGSFYHESLHKVINPIVYEQIELNRKLNDLVSLSQEKLEGDYNDLNTMICESLVRTIDRFLVNEYYYDSDKESLYNLIESEYKLGHILCFSLMENLYEYQESNMTLRDYYPILVSKINIHNEIDRWNNYWNKQ